jgi:hypothetical protein
MGKQLQSSKPKGFLPPKGTRLIGALEWAKPSKVEPPFLTSTHKLKGARKRGVEFEQACSKMYEQRFGELYVPGPWFIYKEIGLDQIRWCQPDGLLFLPFQSRIVIVEMKLQHTADAWWQLRHTYLPIISKIFPAHQWEYSLLEVTKWYDKDTPFPERYKMCSDILALGAGELGVHIWTHR